MFTHHLFASRRGQAFVHILLAVVSVCMPLLSTRSAMAQTGDIVMGDIVIIDILEIVLVAPDVGDYGSTPEPEFQLRVTSDFVYGNEYMFTFRLPKGR